MFHIILIANRGENACTAGVSSNCRVRAAHDGDFAIHQPDQYEGC